MTIAVHLYHLYQYKLIREQPSRNKEFNTRKNIQQKEAANSSIFDQRGRKFNSQILNRVSTAATPRASEMHFFITRSQP